MIELNHAEDAYTAAKNREREAHGALETARAETMTMTGNINGLAGR